MAGTLACTLHLKTHLADFSQVEAALETLCGPDGLTAKIATETRLVLEEVFTNIVKYAHADRREHHPVTIHMHIAPGWLELEVLDDGIPFNPLTHYSGQSAKPFAERADGLMGLSLIRALMDECRYERSGRINHLVLRKRLHL